MKIENMEDEVVMMCEGCIFLKNDEYCMLFKEKNDGQYKHWWCKVKPPMTSDELIKKIKEDIEDFFEDEDDDKYEYTYDLLEAIYDYIIYETDKNRINKSIDDVMQRMQNDGERIEQDN